MTKVSPPPMGKIVVIGSTEYGALWALVHQAAKPVPSGGKERKERLVILQELARQARVGAQQGDGEAQEYFTWLQDAMGAAGITVEP